MDDEKEKHTLRIGPLFAVPFAQIHNPDADALHQELIPLFLEKESQGDKFKKLPRFDTQHGELFESRFDLFYWPDEPVRKLAAFCHQNVASLLRRVTEYSDEDFKKLVFDYHAWFHITRKGGFQGLHNHPNASWSGIYCVDKGDEVPERPDNGVVRLHDTRQDSAMYMDAGNRKLRSPYALAGKDIHHENGKLIMFPSYLHHEIFPYIGERPRIVVAFNCWVRLDNEILRNQ